MPFKGVIPTQRRPAAAGDYLPLRHCFPGFLGRLFQTPLYHLRPVGELSL